MSSFVICLKHYYVNLVTHGLRDVLTPMTSMGLQWKTMLPVTFLSPVQAQRCVAVRPLGPVALALAPRCKRSLILSSLLANTASCRGLAPPPLPPSTSAPLSRSRSDTSPHPPNAAQCRGVHLWKSWASRRAPC